MEQLTMFFLCDDWAFNLYSRIIILKESVFKNISYLSTLPLLSYWYLPIILVPLLHIHSPFNYFLLLIIVCLLSFRRLSLFKRWKKHYLLLLVLVISDFQECFYTVVYCGENWGTKKNPLVELVCSFWIIIKFYVCQLILIITSYGNWE